MKGIEYLHGDVVGNSDRLDVSLLVQGIETSDRGLPRYSEFSMHEILSPLSKGPLTVQDLIVFPNQ